MVINQIDRAQQFEWIVEQSDPRRVAYSFVLLNPGPSLLEDFLTARNMPVLRLPYKTWRDLPLCLLRLARHWLRKRPDLVHGHLHIGAFVALTVAWLLGVPRIYTRHHSTLHHEYHPHAVWRDKLINRLAQRILAISPAVVETLVEKEGADPTKIHLLPHGLKLESFMNPDPDGVESLKRKYNPENRRPVIGVISRFTYWKGVQDIIAAWPRVLERHPNALLLLANAQGDYTEELFSQLQNLPSGSWQAIRFEPNAQSLYRLMDVFVHVPIDPLCEAYGQTYVEASAAGVAMICTLSGIAREFIRHGENAWVVPYQSPEAIAAGVLALLDDPEQARRLAERARADVLARYDLPPFIEQLLRIYGV